MEFFAPTALGRSLRSREGGNLPPRNKSGSFQHSKEADRESGGSMMNLLMGLGRNSDATAGGWTLMPSGSKMHRGKQKTQQQRKF